MKAERYPHPVKLIYGNRIEMQILYWEELESIRETLDLEIRHVLSEPPRGWSGLVGELSPDMIDRCHDEIDDNNALFFVCGPPAMMNSVQGTLARRGLPRNRIVSERFKYD